jgi:hypothetical protein
MSKEKKAPNHIKIKKAQHPAANTKLIQILENVPDSRGPSCNFKHPLTTILFITIVCSLCGANDWKVIVIQAQAMRNWLSQYVDLSQGTPCVMTPKIKIPTRIGCTNQRKSAPKNDVAMDETIGQNNCWIDRFR